MVNIDTELCVWAEYEWDFQLFLQSHILVPVKDFKICPAILCCIYPTTVANWCNFSYSLSGGCSVLQIAEW